MYIFKIYNPDNEAMIFTSLKQIRNFLSLNNDEVKRICNRGVHSTNTGVEVITWYR